MHTVTHDTGRGGGRWNRAEMDQKKLDEIFDAIREGDEDYLGA
eukprot:COSAG02_NODE_72074_length_188_cov_19.764045_1_plen_42_part_01